MNGDNVEEVKIEHKETGGIGMLAYSVIPAALGAAALLWLGFATGLVEFKHQQGVARKANTLAERMDNRVGVVEPLRDPVSLVIKNKGCLVVQRAFIDGDTLTMYLRNGCNHSLDYYAWHWQQFAPNGTMINSDYKNDISGLEGDAVVEKQVELENDDRVVKIVVFAQDHV